MCITPIQIPNPNYGKNPLKGYNYLKDCTSAYINVDCGHCYECIAKKQMYIVQRIQMEAWKNYLFFGTLTYNEESMPRLITSQGYEYRHVEYKQLTNAIKRMYNDNAYGIPWKYIAVTERGGINGRPHIHIIQLFKKEDIGKEFYDVMNFEQEHKWTLLNYWQKNEGSKRKPIYKDLCTYRESIRNGKVHSTYDWHYVNPILTKEGCADAAFYVLKYMMKESGWENKVKGALFTNYDKREATAYWDLIKSRQTHSLGFGLNAEITKEGRQRKIIPDEEIIEYLVDGVQRSLKIDNPFPIFYVPESLTTFPLCTYYKENGKIYNVADATRFWYKNTKGAFMDNSKPPDEKEFSQIIKGLNDYKRKLKRVDLDQFSEDETLYK